MAGLKVRQRLFRPGAYRGGDHTGLHGGVEKVFQEGQI